MGHAHVGNLSRFFIRRLYAKGKLSIAACVEAMVLRGEKLHAGEGAYEDAAMLAQGVEDIVWFLIGLYDGVTPPQPHAVIEPVELDDTQHAILDKWIKGLFWEHEDAFDDLVILDSIQWRFAPGWRVKYHKGGMPYLQMTGN